MGDIEYDAAEAARYSELHPDARFVLAEDYTALTAERDASDARATSGMEWAIDSIAALTAERDELQAIIVAPPGLNEWSHEGDKITAIYSHRPAYAKSEADAKYLVRCHNHNLQMIHERECERDELQRRLAAVVAMLEPGSGQLGHVEDENTMSLSIAEWNLLEQAYTRAVAIAEGRTP